MSLDTHKEMKSLVRWAALACLLVLLCCNPGTCQHPTLPILDMDNLPATNFTCKEKVIGGYYADVYTGCQMFHVCTLDEKGEIHDYKFRCLMGTVFDQETRVCERADDVDCTKSESFFHLNNELYGPGIIPSTANIKVSDRILDATRISELSNAAPSTTTPPSVVFPETSFSCHDKIPGGLYADVEAGCVVFHICSVEPDSSTKDNKFVCGAGTLFDQTTRTCQAADKVDCARSPSLYYLNDPLRGPVFLELEAQLPEQQFDFPRIPIPDSQNSRRVKRDEDEAVDLCRTRPLGSPLADLTSQCRNYTVCEARGDGGGGGLVERRLPCKKDFLFSQLRRRCVPEKKVNCAKETLGEILGLGGVRSSSSGTSRRKRAASLLLSHRFRRAALPPLANLVRTHGVEDARGRRALYSLAALQQWAQENARHTAFINVYTLNTRGKEGSFAKKSLVDGGADPYASQEESHNYGYISRSKRDVNGTQIEEPATSDAFGSPADAHHEAKVEPVSETTGHSIAVVAPKTTVVRHPSVHKSVVLPVTSTVSSTVPSLLTTLSTLTITGASTPTSKTTTSTTTVTVTPFTVTVTTTETKIVPTETSLLAGQSSASPTSTAAPSLTAERSPLPTVSLSPTVESIVNSAVTESIRIDSSSPSDTKPEAVTPVTEASSSVQSVPQEANINQEATTTVAPEAQNSTTPAASTTTETSTLSTTAGSTTVSSSTASSTVEPAVNIKAESTTVTSSAESSVVNSTIESTTIASSTESTVVKEEAAPDTITESSSTTSTTTPSTTTSASTPETTVSTVSTTSTSPPEVTKSALEDAPSANATATTGQPADFVFPEGSINVSTTVVPGEEDTLSNGTLVQPTPAPPTLGTFTRDNLPETNFTCKDKQLEQFYPDPEANCQVFHYCSPGFVKQQVLDLKFLCTGATMFDINTQKCEDSANVTCKYTEIDTKPPQPADPPTTTTEEPAPPTDIPVTTTSSTTTTASTTTSTTTEAPKNTTEAAPTTTTGAPVNTTEAPHDGHHNWNATKTEVESAGDKSDVASTTLETEVREVTEVALPETETVTDRAAREEVSTSTEGLEDAETTTEYFLVQEPEINTELGPIALPSSSTEELPVESLENPEGSETPVSTSVPGTESPTEASTLESISPQTPAPTEAAPPTEAPTVSEVSEGNIVSIATNASDSNHTAATSGEVAL